jgi:hypothetical protein
MRAREPRVKREEKRRKKGKLRKTHAVTYLFLAEIQVMTSSGHRAASRACQASGRARRGGGGGGGRTSGGRGCCTFSSPSSMSAQAPSVLVLVATLDDISETFVKRLAALATTCGGLRACRFKELRGWIWIWIWSFFDAGPRRADEGAERGVFSGMSLFGFETGRGREKRKRNAADDIAEESRVFHFFFLPVAAICPLPLSNRRPLPTPPPTRPLDITLRVT